VRAPNAALTELGALPPGVTFTDNGDGTATIAGSPATSSGGLYQLAITAANGVGADAHQSFALTVNEPPQITSGGFGRVHGRIGRIGRRHHHRIPRARDLGDRVAQRRDAHR